MKLTKLALAASVAAMMTSAHAAVLNVAGITGAPTDLLLLDNAGNPLTSGFVALYTFSGGAPGDFASLQAVGATGQLGLIELAPGNSPVPGGFGSSFNVANDGSLNGQNLFLVVGTGGADVANATQLGIIDTGLNWDKADNPPPPSSRDYALTGASNIVLGDAVASASADWSAIGLGQVDRPGIALAIPEPSSSLLFGLAGLTLLIRRRR